jgi:unsaturated rhamnogalacturonyl hydrolase
MAQAKFGRGMVLATASPWLTNEFTDGRKLPREYDNYAAGQEMVRWLLGQIP